MSLHAVLGASSAGRWMNCLGSPRAIAELPEGERDRRSLYAAEGTAAHSLGERCLRSGERAEAHLGRAIRVEDWPTPFKVTEEMADAVQVYLDAVAAERVRLPNAELLIEERVYPLAGQEEEMFGTADAILWDPVESEVVVIDYKHGAGVVVEAEENPQLKYYGLGAVRRVAGERGAEAVERVTVIIVQPRARHAEGSVRRVTMTGRDLVEWGGTLRSAAAATKRDDAPLAAGSWCRWCPMAGPRCPAMTAQVMERAQVDFEDLTVSDPAKRLQLMLPNPSDPVAVGRAAAFVPLLELWCAEAMGMAERLALQGIKVPGQKLVRKRSNRQWKGEEAEVLAALREKGIPDADLFVAPELKSPAQMEKLKAVGKAWVAENTVKPEGGLTLVPEDDPKPEVKVTPIREEFEDLSVTLLPAEATKE